MATTDPDRPRLQRGGEAPRSPRLRRRTFSYEEAQATFPVVRDLTIAAVRHVESLCNRVRSLEDQESRRGELEETYGRVIQAWTEEIERVGCEVRGLWQVDWFAGDGYWCWTYPEVALFHFHGPDHEHGGSQEGGLRQSADGKASLETRHFRPVDPNGDMPLSPVLPRADRLKIV